MANEINAVFTPATVTQLAFHPAAEPRRTTPQAKVEEPRAPVLDSHALKHAVEQMNALASIMNHRLSFSVDQETHDIIVKVVDADTDKVIRELPPAELQKLHKSIKEALGLLIDKLI
jgi:flagellar protein FlaG